MVWKPSGIFECRTIKYFQLFYWIFSKRFLPGERFSHIKGLIKWNIRPQHVLVFSCAAHSGLCLTEPCIAVASAVMSALDRSVDPCQDFYNFACGGWMRNNPLPEGKSRWEPFSNLWEHNMLVMKHLLGSGLCLFELFGVLPSHQEKCYSFLGLEKLFIQLIRCIYFGRKHNDERSEQGWRKGPEILSGLHEWEQDWGIRS